MGVFGGRGFIGKARNKNIVGKLKKCCIIWDLSNRKNRSKIHC